MNNCFYIILTMIIIGNTSCMKGTINDEDFCRPTSDEKLFPCSNINLYNIKSSITSNSIFENTIHIGISPYTYPAPDSLKPLFGNLIELNGDSSINLIKSINKCCELETYLDKYPVEPIFKWNSVQSNLIAIAIFDSKVEISLDGQRIQNIEDIVWTWNSGMGTGNQSSGKTIVNFSHGRDMLNGEIKESTTSLRRNQAYLWAIWAWDETGTKIKYSSAAIPFITEALPRINVVSAEQFLNGAGSNNRVTWELTSAINSHDGSDVFNTIPHKQIEFSINCDDFRIHFMTFPDSLHGAFSNNVALNPNFPFLFFSNLTLICDEKLSGRLGDIEVIYELN